ncbi:MAG: hypothetical protein ACYSTL_05560 [Planctomycetota bacterium]|jgi:hypothetical protein
MAEDLFTRKLERFKESEKPEVVLFVADNPDSIKIIIAWTNTTVTRTEDVSALGDESENAIWEWLWSNAIFSEEELLAKSGRTRCRFNRELKKLIGNRILYPDGTVNSFVQRYLREKVLNLFEGRPNKRRSTVGAK